jgi:FkbM family methyltransferase
VRTDPSAGRSYRDRTFLEALADALPAGGAIGRLRTRIRPFFHRLLAVGGTPMRSVLPGGEEFLVSPAFRHVSWNPDEYAAFRAAVRPGAIVLDVGANVGAYAVLFGRWSGPGGHVFAFEPDPSAFAGLGVHIALNGLADRITPVQVAVTDGASPRARLAVSESSGISRLVDSGGAGSDSGVEVTAISIDDFCRRRGVTPSVIKIDAEGAELQVLRGARATIGRAGPALALFVEMHPAIWRAAGTRAEDLQRECDALGYQAERLDGSREGLWASEGVCLRLTPARNGESLGAT